MPVYQYACTECGHQLEARQSFSDDPLTECPACAGRLRKVLSAVGVVFKGSGFYRTDSRKDSSTSNGSSGTGSDSDTSKKSSEKSGGSDASTSGSDKSSSSSKTSTASATPTAS